MEKSEGLVVVLLLIAIALSIASVVMVNNNVQSQAVTGKATNTGIVNAYTDAVLSFNLAPATVNFGNVSQNQSYNTDTGLAPFGVTNTGTVKLDMKLKADQALFNRTASTFKYKSTCGTGCTNITSYADVGVTTDKTVYTAMDFAVAQSTGTVGIAIAVASDEPAGAKTSTLTFTATQSA